MIWASIRRAWCSTAASSNAPPGSCHQHRREHRGRKKLYLVTTDGGDKIDWDHADWGLARLTKPDGTCNG